jgi:hypothetical protein
MKLTLTYLSFVHGRCKDSSCSVCRFVIPYTKDSLTEIDSWLRKRLTVQKTGAPVSPWWEVEENKAQCYAILRRRS